MLIDRTVTVLARAIRSGWDPGPISTNHYVLMSTEPVIDPGTMAYSHSIQVTATCATAQARLYWSTSENPTTNSASVLPGHVFTFNPQVNGTFSLQVIAHRYGWTETSPVSATFISADSATTVDIGDRMVPVGDITSPIPGAPLPGVMVYDGGSPRFLATVPGGVMLMNGTYYLVSEEAPMGGETAVEYVYQTEGQSGAPQVDLSAVPYDVVIHGNNRIRTRHSVTNPANGAVEERNGDLWEEDGSLRAANRTGFAVIHFEEGGAFKGAQVVELRANVPDGTNEVLVGEELLPVVNGSVAGRSAYVSRGRKESRSDDGYIYLHQDDGPYNGRVYAARENHDFNNMEVFWMREGLHGITWPYEMNRYQAAWPAEGRILVRRPDSTEPKVTIPSDLSPYLMPAEQFLVGDQPDGRRAHGYLEGEQFYTDGEGYSLLLLETGPAQNRDWVDFEVVHSVWRTNELAGGQGTNWLIATEITEEDHQGSLSGYIYADDESENDDLFHPGLYGEKNAAGMTEGDIFAVNEGTLEVWWSDLTHTNDQAHGIEGFEGIQWPAHVMVYTNQWPTDAEVITIADTRGSGPISEATYPDWTLYYQNDPDLPGFNPNNEHAFVQPANGGSGLAIFPLRNDLGPSDPFVLLASPRSDAEPAKMKVWSVEAGDFTYPGTAATIVQPPYPLSVLPICEESSMVSGPTWRDRKNVFWTRAAGNDGGTAEAVFRYFYEVQPGFYFPDSYTLPSGAVPAPGDHVPWMDGGTYANGPVDVTYIIAWPPEIPVMPMAWTQAKAGKGLPEIWGQTSVEVIYQQAVENKTGESVLLIDPVQPRGPVSMETPPGDLETHREQGKIVFSQLPAHLRKRLLYDETEKELTFRGALIEPALGDAYLLLNTMTEPEYEALLAFSEDMESDWHAAIEELYSLTSSVTNIPPNTRFDKLALTSGEAASQGYVTLAFNNSTVLNEPADPISLEIIQVGCPLYGGQVAVIQSDNPFDEILVLKHKNDFAGHPDLYEFEWIRSPAREDGSAPQPGDPTWVPYDSGPGVVDITISADKDPPLITLSDNYYLCRYRPLDLSHPCGTGWTDWTDIQLAEGWVKRVLRAINPYEQRFTDFRETEINTLVSMIAQAGERFEGSVPLNISAADEAGLIEIYQTVLNRGAGMSINGTPPADYAPANDALLLAASRIADLYMLLGNESYADALDPTIGYGTEHGDYGSAASSIHCFMNQTADLLEEELKLLRGRDNALVPYTHVGPVFNRLVWNVSSDITGGEVAYMLNYEITDEVGPDGAPDPDGFIDENDAKVLYPQGHGDTWGSYLTSTKGYYGLLQNTNFSWAPRIEAILLGGQPLNVDYLDERKFAKAAAAKARTGAEIVNLTYRQEYTEEPAGQWQGYPDVNTNRAWGVSDWASRAGQAAYFDWLVANSLLPPVDTDQEHEGIQVIDRTTVTHLREIAAAADAIQQQVNQADLGLNPLGLAKNVVPFDIDPSGIDQGSTHFEQIYGRAAQGLVNAVAVFDHAQNASQMLRRQFDTVDDFQQAVEDREFDFRNRLIELYGYPYSDDIGPGQTYPSDYDGPDYLHFDYVDPSELFGAVADMEEVEVQLREHAVDARGGLSYVTNTVVFHLSPDFGMVKPFYWTGSRRAPGEIQIARSDLLQAGGRFGRTLTDYGNLLDQIEDQAALLAEQRDVHAEVVRILNLAMDEQIDLNEFIMDSRAGQLVFRGISRVATHIHNAIAEALPQSVLVGTSSGGDLTSVGRGAIRLRGAILSEVMTIAADALSLDELGHQQAKEIVSAQSNIEITTVNQDFAVAQQIAALEQLVRQEAVLRLDLYTQQEALLQSAGRYTASVQRALRIESERLRFRKQTAAQLQDYRYKDMAFRIFRNDALQKYRAQFDLAAMYVYLAARAYDYETNLREGDYRGPGDEFMTQIVKARSIGEIINGVPTTSANDGGLADPMARMMQNWSVLEGQLGFNNPQTETGRFSLRTELFRVLPGQSGNENWRRNLLSSRVENILDLPEFQRYCLPFYPQQAEEPGLVITFSSSVNFGHNFFGWLAGGGDNAYDSANFATKVRSVGVWFSNYNNILGSGMINTPRVYLVPVGSDIMRSPTDYTGETREWTVVDQVLPVPFPLSGAELTDPSWIPINDSLYGTFAAIRRHGRIRAYHDSGSFNPGETINNSRLIGRSVWNTRWMLIIPGGTLHWDRDEGVNRFIYGAEAPGGPVTDPHGVERDGYGVSDIKLFFQTYAYEGM